jgi:hypothetical protein
MDCYFAPFFTKKQLYIVDNRAQMKDQRPRIYLPSRYDKSTKHNERDMGE